MSSPPRLGELDLGVLGLRERDQPRRLRVLLADLLQQAERVGVDPRLVLGQEGVELGHAERVGVDRRQQRVLVASRPGLAARRQRTRQRGECELLAGIVSRREHEGCLLVNLGELQHRRRRGPPVDAAPRCTAWRPD